MTDPVKPFKRLWFGLCIALWILVVFFTALTIWVDENAINPALGIGVNAFISSFLYAFYYRREWK